MKVVVLLMFWVHTASAATHSLRYMYTTISGKTDFPEYTVAATLDGLHFEYFDSVTWTLVPRTDWFEQNAGQYHWELFNEPLTNQYKGFKSLLVYLQQRFNQSELGAVHTFQNMYGCDWDSVLGHEDAVHRHGYDGEDLIWLDLGKRPMRWVAAMPEAEPLQRKWNSLTNDLRYLQWYFTKECLDDLRKYVTYSQEITGRVVPPLVFLLQPSPSSPVSCLATGFYPRGALMSWTRAGEEHYEDVEYIDTLPNPDGTFQLRSLLFVSREEWEKSNFSCVVQHQGREITMTLDPSTMITNWTTPPTPAPGLIPGLVVGVVLTALSLLVGLVFWRMRKKRRLQETQPPLVSPAPVSPTQRQRDEELVEEEEEEDLTLMRRRVIH